MKIKIEPFKVDNVNAVNAESIEITATEVVGTSYAPIVAFLDESGAVITTKNLILIKDEEYKNWKGDNQFLFEKLKNEILDLVIIEKQ